MNFKNFKKDVQTRANNFFSSKTNSLNISAYKFKDNYIDILKSHTLCILDTETTGLDENDKLWQVSIRVVKNNQQIDELYEMFKPANYDSLIPSEYTNKIKEDSENLNYIPLQKINDFIAKYNNSVVIAHNISFDIPHCENEHIIFPEDCYYFDTMWIIKNAIPSMSKLCVFNKVECDSNLQHNAHYDTRLLKDCVINWLNNYRKPIKFSNGEQNLYKLVKKLENPSCKITDKDKDTFENSIEKLKNMNYTIFYNKSPVNITDSYYKVIINKTACYIEYNYTGEDIKKNVEEEVSIEFTPSEEQSKIISAIKDNNVTVDAVAGSGKTTTALFIAKEYPDKKILLLTYNKQLQLDNKEKCSKCDNIDVFTFHAFCGRIYKTTCLNDSIMYKCINSDCSYNPINYDIIIVDEAQDMLEVYYLFIKKILSKNTKLMLVGDKYQNIYRFNGATSEYLEHPEKYFDRSFVHLSLQMSFRLTNQMSNFINKNVMHQERIKTCKEGEKVSIVFSNNQYRSYNDAAKYFSNKIIELIKSGVDVNDIMILSYSVCSGSVAKCVKCIKQLTNLNVYVPINDDYPINKECCKDKLLFSSIHQSKGLERDYIFLFQFDTSYCYAYNDYLHELNNLFYVALTRAKKKLTIFIRIINVVDMIIEPFPFISFTDEDYIEYTNKIIFEPTLKEEQVSPRRKTDVTSICKFVKSETVEKLKKYIEVETIPSKRIKLNIKSTCNNEEVSNISGNAVTAMMGISDVNVRNYISELKKSYCNFNKDKYKTDYVRIPDTIKNIQDMLKLMTYVEYYEYGLVHKPLQLSSSDFNWITSEQYEIMKSNTEENLKGFGSFEVPATAIIEKVKNSNKSVFNNNIVLNNKYSIDKIYGRIDMINNDDIVEFKLVDNLTNTHIYQTLLYAFMKNKNTALLYNIKSGELLRITCNHPQEVLELLLEKFIEQ